MSRSDRRTSQSDLVGIMKICHYTASITTHVVVYRLVADDTTQLPAVLLEQCLPAPLRVPLRTRLPRCRPPGSQPLRRRLRSLQPHDAITAHERRRQHAPGEHVTPTT